MNIFRRLCSFMLLWPLLLQAQSYESLWKEVTKAENENRPQSAITVLQQIKAKSIRERKAPQLLKATLCLAEKQQELTPDSFFVYLSQMEQWAKAEQNEVTKSIILSVLADDYAGYAHRRTNRDEANLDVDEVPTDIKTWNGNLFVRRIDTYLQEAVKPMDALRKMSAKDYSPFVTWQRNNRSKYYGHDLYHLIARRAINTYQQIASLNEPESETLSKQRIGILYKDLKQTYSGMADAYVLTSLDEMDWMRSEEKNGKVYEEQLDSLINHFGNAESCVEVYIRKANYLNGRQRWYETLETCREGIKRYGKRANSLRNIQNDVLQQHASLNLSTTAYPGETIQAHLHYRNMTDLHVEIVRLQGKKDCVVAQHLTLVPHPQEKVCERDLPYCWSDTVINLSVPKETGSYGVIIKENKGDSIHLNITRLRAMLLPLQNDQLELTVVDNQSGQPVEDASVIFYVQEDEKEQQIAEGKTGKDGKCLISVPRRGYFYKVVKDDDNTLNSRCWQNGFVVRNQKPTRQDHLTLLTDRGIYRPGQTVHVKGVAYWTQDKEAKIIEGRTYKVQLLDVNWKPVSEKEVKTNDFGSFTLDFTLPASCLNGRFTIRTEHSEGQTQIRVEEYKRPTFEIILDNPKQVYRLGETLKLTGLVKALNGRSIQDMPVTYTVRKQQGYFWRRKEEPLHSDTVMTDKNGCFEIPLTLQGDGQHASYDVTASLTDEAGETQQQSLTIEARKEAYNLQVKMPSVFNRRKPEPVVISVTNSMNVPQQTEGTFEFKNEQTQEIQKSTFIGGEPLNSEMLKALPSGTYTLKACVKYHESEQTIQQRIRIFDTSDSHLLGKETLFTYMEQSEITEGNDVAFYVGSTEENVYLLMDIIGKQGRVESRTINLNNEVKRIDAKYLPTYGDGMTVLLSMIKHGQYYEKQLTFAKPLPKRNLNLRWEVMRDHLKPGQKEEWRMVISNPQDKPAAAELLAMLYDASLDKLAPLHQSLNVYFGQYIPSAHRQVNALGQGSLCYASQTKYWKIIEPNHDYDAFYNDMSIGTYNLMDGPILLRSRNMPMMAMSKSVAMLESANADEVMADDKLAVANNAPMALSAAAEEEKTLDSDNSVRSNFAETAFFLPMLRTNEVGEVICSFTMPESVTRWNFRGYAHTKDMMTGTLEGICETKKDFMLVSHLPRFVREGDHATLAATISNLSEKEMKGQVTLQLFDPATDKVFKTLQQPLELHTGETKGVSFDCQLDGTHRLLGIRMVAKSQNKTFSDGEQNILPVLSNKEHVVEAISIPIRGNETKTISLESLFNHHHLAATNRQLTLEMTGNPAWLAVCALPTMALPTTDNAIAWSAAIYANGLAHHYMQQHPKVCDMLQRWQQPEQKDALKSALEQNEDLKEILLAETPWVLDAENEDAQLKNLQTLVDLNKLSLRQSNALEKLSQLQLTNGAWPWYHGMRESRYVTTWITTLLLRLKTMTGTVDPKIQQMLDNALTYMHQEAKQEYERIQQRKIQNIGLSNFALNYLYLNALNGCDVPQKYHKYYRYFLQQVRKELKSEQMDDLAKMAYILMKNHKQTDAEYFLTALREHLINEDEMGSHFAFLDENYGWWCSRAIPVQVQVMEALNETGKDQALIEEMKIWLLKQKQVNSWRTNIESADAVYALLSTGSDLLANEGKVTINLGGHLFSTSETKTDGLNYIKETFKEDARYLSARQIKVTKHDDGIAWGAVYGSYDSPIKDLTDQNTTHLSIEKELYVERLDDKGKTSLQRINVQGQIEKGGTLKVGDKIVVRMIIRADRAYDFVTLKDSRAACLEPIGALSGYQWGNGMGYYREVKDASTNFYFDRLTKGTYVLTYNCRIAHDGIYQRGIAKLQSAYAPEFVAHTAGGMVEINTK